MSMCCVLCKADFVNPKLGPEVNNKKQNNLTQVNILFTTKVMCALSKNINSNKYLLSLKMTDTHY